MSTPPDTPRGSGPGSGSTADAKAGEGRADGARGHIRSFSGRRGHFTAGQRLAYETLRDRWCLPRQHAPVDPHAVFGRQAPLVVEIGFGMGETTARIAAGAPERDFLGVEVYPAGVGSLLARIEAAGLRNLRIVQHDAVEVVRDMIAPGALAGVHVYFPDPWPKKRHHKRRLIQPPFVSLLASRLAPGGYLHCATDWEDYAVQMLEVLSREPLLDNDAGATTVGASAPLCRGFSPRPAWRPQTKFEARGLRLGHGVWDLLFLRRPSGAPLSSPS